MKKQKLASSISVLSIFGCVLGCVGMTVLRATAGEWGQALLCLGSAFMWFLSLAYLNEKNPPQSDRSHRRSNSE